MYTYCYLLAKVIFDIPLFETTWELSKYMPFVILNCLSYQTINESLPISDCTPRWKNRTTRISKYLAGHGALEGFVIFLDALGMKGIWQHYSFRDVEKCYSLLYGLLADVSIESKCNVSF